MEERKKQERIYTKPKQARSTYFMPLRDRDLMLAAAYRAGESRSEFLRRSVKERALKILGVQPTT
jgi:hypothetical protein